MTSSPTIEYLALAYIDDRIRRGRFRGETPRTVRSILLRFAESVGPSLPANKLTRAKVEKWANSLTLSPSTLKHRISAVRAFTAWLASEDYIRSDPGRSLTSPRLPRSIPRGLNPDAVSALYSVLPDTRAELIVSLMVQEGLRCLEVAGLQFGDVDRSERALFIRGKGGHERVLPISTETWTLLTRYLIEHPATYGPLIRRYDLDGTTLPTPVKPGTISKMVSGWMNQAGLKSGSRDGVSAHALRHTAATDMLKSGAHLVDVQAALGHSSLSMTQRYLPWTLGDLRGAMGGRTYRRPNPQADVA